MTKGTDTPGTDTPETDTPETDTPETGSTRCSRFAKDMWLSIGVGIVAGVGIFWFMLGVDAPNHKGQLVGYGIALGLFMGLLTYLETPSGKGGNPEEDTRSAVIALMMLLLIAQLGIIDYFVIAKIPPSTEGYSTIVTTWITATTVQTIVALGAIAFKYLFSSKASSTHDGGLTGSGE